MTDRELLEFAAKAAGYDAKWCNHFYEPFRGFEVNGSSWDPLTDDGDALRLAVKLKFIVGTYDTYASVCHTMILGGQGDVPDDEVVWVHSTNGDPYAATRRAIVLAAAAIGKDLP